MEHRCDRRVERQVSVVIQMGRSKPIRGVTQNISCGGMYLKTETGRSLKKNVLVKVTLAAGEPVVALLGLVLRCERDAAALMFVEQASPQRQAMMALMARGSDAKRPRAWRLTRAAGA